MERPSSPHTIVHNLAPIKEEEEELNVLIESNKTQVVRNEGLIVLEDFIRFDLIRTGALCCIGYKVSVQYDDDFLRGKFSGKSRNCFCLNSINSIQFFNSGEKGGKINRFRKQDEAIFKIDYPSLILCFRSKKKRKFAVKTSQEEIGFILTSQDIREPLEIYNSRHKSNFTAKKIRLTTYMIENSLGEKVGLIDLFRGLRGGITSYGVSTVDDNIDPGTKALFFAGAVAMDVEERESELKCTFLWTPLISLVVIILFTILPWIYYNNKDVQV